MLICIGRVSSYVEHTSMCIFISMYRKCTLAHRSLSTVYSNSRNMLTYNIVYTSSPHFQFLSNNYFTSRRLHTLTMGIFDYQYRLVNYVPGIEKCRNLFINSQSSIEIINFLCLETAGTMSKKDVNCGAVDQYFDYQQRRHYGPAERAPVVAVTVNGSSIQHIHGIFQDWK